MVAEVQKPMSCYRLLYMNFQSYLTNLERLSSMLFHGNLHFTSFYILFSMPCAHHIQHLPKKKLFRYILSASIFKKQHLHLPYRGEKLSFTPFAYRSLFSYCGTFPRKDGQTTKPKSGCSGATLWVIERPRDNHKEY